MGLETIRADIDQLDERIVALLAQRLALCEDVAREKSALGLEALQSARVSDVEQHYRDLAARTGISPEFAAAVFGLIHDEALAIESGIIAGGKGE